MRTHNGPFTELQIPIFRSSTGILTLPSVKGQFPSVILLHGFASHKDEVGNFFKLLSKVLAQNHIASLRFTFQGFDLPENTLVRSTIEDMIVEAQAAYLALSASTNIEEDRVALLGFSLGGAIALLTAARYPSNYKALVTWSCAGDLKSTFHKLMGEAMYEQAISNDEITIDLGWRKIRLAQAFFKSLSNHDTLNAIKAYSNPFFAIAGSEDYLSIYLDRYYQNAPGALKEKLLIPGADHIFNILEDPNRFAPQVIYKTVSWLKTNL